MTDFVTRIKGKIKAYWGELVFIFSNTYALAFSMLAGLVATAFIEPADMGVIQTVLLVQTYLQFLQLGVFNGLNRNLAFYKAKKEYDTVQDMVDTTYSVSYIVSLIGGFISLIYLLYYFFTGRSAVYVFSALLLFVLMVFKPLSTAIETTYRSGQEFKKLGIIRNIETTIHAVLSLLPIVLGYLGKIIADTVHSVVGYILRFRQRPYKKEGRGSFSSFKILLATGFPILLSGYIWSVFTACDRTYIARFMTTEDMGLYSLSNYVILAVMAVPHAVNSLLYPKAASRYGSTGDIHSLMAFWKKSIVVYSLLLLPICIILYFTLPYLVESFMPKYVRGIGAARLALLTCMTFVSQGPAVLFGTIRKNLVYLLIGGISVLIFWVVALLLREYFVTIESVAMLRFGISLINMLMILFFSYHYVK